MGRFTTVNEGGKTTPTSSSRTSQAFRSIRFRNSSMDMHFQPSRSPWTALSKTVRPFISVSRVVAIGKRPSASTSRYNATATASYAQLSGHGWSVSREERPRHAPGPWALLKNRTSARVAPVCRFQFPLVQRFINERTVLCAGSLP